jgi:hypothetical protein
MHPTNLKLKKNFTATAINTVFALVHTQMA